MIEDVMVYVIDDDPGMRISLASLLGSVGYPVRAFASSEAFQQHPVDPVPACLILDVRLQGRSGLEFQRELARAGRDLPIVFITGHGDVPMSVSAMKAGAIEFLVKPFRDQDLLDAVHAGIERSRRRRDEDAAAAQSRERYAALTPREREVLGLVVSGLMNKQVAERLQLSEVTVKVHRAQIMRKLGVRTLADLVRLADRIEREAPGA